jgi:hypothetical protein
MVASQTSYIILSAVFSYAQIVKADTTSAMVKLKELTRQKERSPGVFKMDFWPAGFDDAVRVFKTILPEISFEPDYQAVPDGHSRTSDGTLAINTAKDLALSILGASMTRSVNLLNLDDPILTAIDLFLAKLNTAIDPNWKLIEVSASISTPNEQFNLDRAKQNHINSLKNNQQRALRDARRELLVSVAYILKRTKIKNWTRENAIARFCKDEESKKILEEAIKTSW